MSTTNGHDREPLHDVPVYRPATTFWCGAIQVRVTALAETLARPGRQIRILPKTGLVVAAKTMAEAVSEPSFSYCTFTVERWTTPPRVELPHLRVIDGRVVFVFTTNDPQDQIERTKGWRKLREDELVKLDPRQ